MKKSEGKWIGKLTEGDQAILTYDKWVTDIIINEAQRCLKEHFSQISGFQSVVLAEAMSYTIETDEFTQILHTGHGHLVTAATFGCQEYFNLDQPGRL